ncbi:MAG: hypothetical protein HKN88_10160 [Gammaproteobacteria bacterium]|nr:hypothetical protein [Gammaproteobacteria bacterium]NNC98419.1 hypothetical protein [Gammaproteobacteria bacterium]
MQIPEKIGSLEIMLSAIIDESCIHTSNCTHEIDGKVMGKAKWAAITKTDLQGYCYLFMCYSDNKLSDSAHESVEEAKEQAEWEYEGITKNWQSAT